MSASNKVASSIERTDSHEQLQVYYYGNSFLLQRVMSILKNQYQNVIFIQLKSSYSQEAIIHDGSISKDVLDNFLIDFNVNHYGDSPKNIVESLYTRLFTGLV